MGRIPLKGKGKVWEKRNAGKGPWRIKSAPVREKASPPLWQREVAHGVRAQEGTQ